MTNLLKLSRHFLKKTISLEKYAVTNKDLTLNQYKIRTNAFSSFQPIQYSATSWNRSQLLSDENFQSFKDLFPQFVTDLTSCDADYYSSEKVVNDRFAKFLNYSIPGGKLMRATIILSAYNSIEKPENLTSENIQLCRIMAWLLELYLSTHNLIDDIVDQSEIRRGLKCWHKLDDNGLSAFYDYILAHEKIFIILKKYFSKCSYYVPTLELFYEATEKLYKSQSLDTRSVKNGSPNFDLFTEPIYKYISDYGNTFNTFNVPIELAMYMASYCDKDLLKHKDVVCNEIGYIFKMQDDYLDCFGGLQQIGKVGSDIKMGKFNWFTIKALQKGNSSQEKLIKECYGKNNPNATTAILNLFDELKLKELYSEQINNKKMFVKEYLSTNFKNDNFRKLFENMISAIDDRKC